VVGITLELLITRMNNHDRLHLSALVDGYVEIPVAFRIGIIFFRVRSRKSLISASPNDHACRVPTHLTGESTRLREITSQCDFNIYHVVFSTVSKPRLAIYWTLV
jgi:hypothetical protein